MTLGNILILLGKIQSSKTLKYLSVPLLTNDDCLDTAWEPDDITSNMLCAGFLEKQGHDSCDGDSGGPLIAIGKDDTAVVYGIVSFGPLEGCGTPNFPGVYTRVSVFLNWIQSNMEGNQNSEIKIKGYFKISIDIEHYSAIYSN